MTNSNILSSFWNELNGKGEFSTQEEWFNSLANHLMNHLSLVVGKNRYRITECEFYYSDIDHKDPYVHCGDEQMTVGKLYLNKAGGLDITFGNPAFPAWGGILIRGIRNLKTNQYVNKITEIVAEVFAALDNIVLEKNGIYLAELEPEEINVEQPIQTTRVRLSKKKQDDENFRDKPYRYIVELIPAHKFGDKEKVVKQLLAENKILSKQVKNILGNYLKQQ